MPLKTWDTQADFDGAYASSDPDGRVAGEPAVELHYQRRAIYPGLEREYHRLIEHYLWPRGSSIAIVGCGFGWSLEILRAAGYEAWGTDPSPYIQATKADTDPADGIAFALEPARVVDELLDTAESRTAFLEASIGTRARFDAVILERCATSLEDAEILQLLEDTEAIARRGATLLLSDSPVQPGRAQDPDMNWKTFEAWRAIVPAAWDIATGSGRVL